MDAGDLIKADSRWELWKCHSFQEYLDKFFIAGKFHSNVPDKIKEAYLTVEKLISYAYFYYPLTEEVDSKMTRIVEMAVRLKAEQLDIKFTRGKPSFYDHILALEKRDDFDKELASALHNLRELRNAFAHPSGPMYYGPMGYENVVTMINIVNRIFFSVSSYKEYISQSSALAEKVNKHLSGPLGYETSDHCYLVSEARPLIVSPDNKKSLWILKPILNSFPQSMEELEIPQAFFLKLFEIVIEDSLLEGYDILTNERVALFRAIDEPNQAALQKFEKQYSSADLQVRQFHESLLAGAIYRQVEKFVYEEFWSTL